jgi:hypothetical protein
MQEPMRRSFAYGSRMTAKNKQQHGGADWSRGLIFLLTSFCDTCKYE